MTAGSIMERVIVKLDMVTKGFQRGMNRANTATRALSKNVSEMGNVIGMSLPAMKLTNQHGGRMSTVMGRAAYGVRMFTHGLRGFRMEMLGVMFFGMMLQQMFLGLLRPVMEAFGVFDLYRLMLLVLFLPVMEMLFEPMLKIMTWFMELPRPVKLVIGIFTIFMIVLGTALFVLGSFALGIGSVILAFGFLGPAITAIGVAISSFGAIIAAVAAVGTVVIIGMIYAWRENFLNFRTWFSMILNGITTIFRGAIEVILGIYDLMIAVMNGDAEAFKAALKRIFEGIITIIKGAMQFILGAVLSISIGIIRVLNGLVNIMYSIGRDMIRKLASGILSSKSILRSAFQLIMPGFALGGLTGLMPKFDDFIWRSGSGPAAISSDDTVMGFKGDMPSGGSVTNNFYGFTRDDLNRELDDRDRRTVDEIRRLIKA